MKNTGNGKHVHLWKHNDMDLFRLFVFKALVIGIFTLLSLFSWIYVFTVRDAACQSVLVPELIACGLVFAGNLLCVFFLGYEDDFFSHVCITFFVTVLVAIVALFLGNASILPESIASGSRFLHVTLRFLTYMAVSFVMSLLPAVLGCGVVLLLVHVFGEPES